MAADRGRSVPVGLNVWSRLGERTFGETERDVEKLKASPDIRPLSDMQLVGTPDQVTEALRAIVAQGAHQLTVNFGDVPRPDGTLLFAEKVLPQL